MSLAKVKLAQKKLESFLADNQEELGQISKQIISLCDPMDASFSGSWAGYHANLYFKNFQTPTVDEMFDPEWGGINGYDPGWQTKTLDEIWKYIISKSTVKFDLDSIDEKLHQLQELCEDLKTQIELTIEDKSKINQKIQKIRTDYSIVTYIKAVGPRNIVSRDSKAIHQGTKVPPHIQCQGFANALSKNLDAAKELIKLAEIVIDSGKAARDGTSYWNYTNPFWLAYKGAIKLWNLIRKHRVTALISLTVTGLTLLAIDYSLAWSNTQRLIKFVISLF